MASEAGKILPHCRSTRFHRFMSMKQLISKKTASAINAQIGQEFFASLQYEAIAAWFRLEGLPRLSAHFAQQAAEERDHAHRFINYLLETGTPLDLPGLPAPQCRFKSAVQAAELALEHEIKVTDSIKGLMDLAEEEGDRFTQNSLQWFITEQLEELSSADELLRMVQRAGDSGLLFVEHFLAGGVASGKGASA
jgi:ferritin